MAVARIECKWEGVPVLDTISANNCNLGANVEMNTLHFRKIFFSAFVGVCTLASGRF